MSFPETFHPSPNFDAEPPHARRGLLVHHTVLGLQDALARLTDPASRVSYHVVIARDGSRHSLVADEHVAWHAGVSAFHGQTGCNRFLLGLAFEGDTYREPLTPEQIASALEWIGPRWARHAWTLEWVADHRQVAPGRKDDLNPAEWDRFQEAIRRWAAAG